MAGIKNLQKELINCFEGYNNQEPILQGLFANPEIQVVANLELANEQKNNAAVTEEERNKQFNSLCEHPIAEFCKTCKLYNIKLCEKYCIYGVK